MFWLFPIPVSINAVIICEKFYDKEGLIGLDYIHENVRRCVHVWREWRGRNLFFWPSTNFKTAVNYKIKYKHRWKWFIHATIILDHKSVIIKTLNDIEKLKHISLSKEKCLYFRNHHACHKRVGAAWKRSTCQMAFGNNHATCRGDKNTRQSRNSWGLTPYGTGITDLIGLGTGNKTLPRPTSFNFFLFFLRIQYF